MSSADKNSRLRLHPETTMPRGAVLLPAAYFHYRNLYQYVIDRLTRRDQ